MAKPHYSQSAQVPGAHWVIGLMSGTSLDGVDGAVIKTDGKQILDFGAHAFSAYTKNERKSIAQAIDLVLNSDTFQLKRELAVAVPQLLSDVTQMLTQKHAVVVKELLIRSSGIKPTLIGYHGQTILHRANQGLTIQLGCGQALANQVNLPVVYDFRANDVAAGGQGAPLVPLYIKALVWRTKIALPIAVINIGGIANATVIAENGQLYAFDIAPGNCLIDDWVWQKAGLAFDDNGSLAASGVVVHRVLDQLMNHRFLTVRPPKSLDRYDFSIAPATGLDLADGAATLCAFSATAIVKSLNDFFPEIRRIIITGGGAKNAELLAMIKRFSGLTVLKAGDLDWCSDFIEAQAFAFLALRSHQGLPITFPETTGVITPLSGGKTAYPKLCENFAGS